MTETIQTKRSNWPLVVVLVLAAFAGGYLISGRAKHLASSATTAPVTSKKQMWTCGMHPQVIQDHPGDCPICHMELTPLKTDQDSGAADAERKVKYWWDPMMNPPYISSAPGKSPMGMDLMPVYEDEVSSGPAVTIDPSIVQNMGLRVAPVTLGSIEERVRAVGYLEEPEPLHRDINLRVSGWVEKLHANIDGMPIEKGQPLFDLYSPEVQIATNELIAARKTRDAATSETARSTADTLYQTTARKLVLWGLEKQQIDQLAAMNTAPETVTFLAPLSGHLTEKKVYEGAGVEAGMLVMRLANRHQIWVDAQVYEQHLPLVKIGGKARVTLVSEPGKVFEGEVIFIHPHLDPMTRTALVRIQVPNDDLHLRQGMYATVEILAQPTPPAPVVPREAVIDTGARQIVFVRNNTTKFEPRQVKLGLSGREGLVQVLAGLAPGEQVVTSGQFLLDSESRLKEAIQKHLNANLASTTPMPNGKPAALAVDDATSKPAEPALKVPHLDEMVAAYLQIAHALGARQQSDQPLGMDSMLASAKQSLGHSQADAAKLVQAVLDGAAAMDGKSLADQRKQFVALSDAFIALLDRSQASQKLYVVHCPMAFDDKGAHWLQDSDKIANPYYATQMKSCGEVKRTIEGK